MHHIQTKKGPIFLYADVGTGKTTIAKRIKEELDNDKTKKIVSVFAPNLKTSNAFLRFVMEEFDVKTDRNYARSLENFQGFLADQYQAGISPVLLIDEAQNLNRDTLKMIHHLFNFSTSTDFLIQMALFGQNELLDRIRAYHSLESRMTPTQLMPLDLDETRQMIEFRWQTAGGKKPPFDDDAVSEIYRYTGGNPRNICKLCDAALLKAYSDGRNVVDKDTVYAAVPEAFVIEMRDE